MQIDGSLNASQLPALLSVSEQSIQKFVDSASVNRDVIETTLSTLGAVVVRGVAIKTPEDFQTCCAAIYPNLRSYKGGDSPRTELAEKVFTSTDYGNEYEVLLHNELSYAGWSPDRVMFGCLQAPTLGGETHLADGRRIHQKLDPKVRERFDQKGVTYWQHLRDDNGLPGTGLSWQDTFETNDAKEVEDYLLESEMTYQWTDLGIRTSATHSQHHQQSACRRVTPSLR